MVTFGHVPVKELRADALTTLDLSNKKLGLAEAHVLAGLLPVSHSLASIDISQNNLGNEGKCAIAKAIPSSVLQSLKCDALNLQADATSLDLRSKQLGAADAELLAAAMTKFMGSLSSIDLSKNSIGSEGAKVLAPAIRDSHSLTECDLRDNQLGKEGWCIIFDTLRDNPQNKIANWDLSYQSIDAEIAKFDVQFTFEEAAQQGGLTCYVSYAKDLFDASTIEAMGEQFLAVLDAIASDPTTAVGDIAIVDDSTRDRVLTQWSSSGADVSVNAATLVERFDAAVAAPPDGVAVRFEGVSLTFSELDSRANRLARTLIGAGAGPDSLVAVALPRSAELVVALVAVVKAGAGYLPVDPSYPRERIEFMIADAAPTESKQ